MRWNFLLHLLLCALLLAQQPSRILRNGPRQQATSAPSTRGADGGRFFEEEEELHALRAPRGPRHEALALPPPARSPVRLDRVMEPGPAPLRCDTAEAHWRAALLPLWSPLEGEPPAPA